jgi:hypothetical protein
VKVKVNFNSPLVGWLDEVETGWDVLILLYHGFHQWLILLNHFVVLWIPAFDGMAAKNSP